MSSSTPTLTRFGRLDGAVNNAGRSAGTPIATSDDDAWRSDYELKVIAALHVARQVLPALETTKGAIVNVLAILARTPNANTTPTSASRLAGLALTKALANEVGPRGIRVNAILIGLIESGQWVRRAEDANVSVRGVLRDDGGELEDPVGPRRSRRGVRRPGRVLAVAALELRHRRRHQHRRRDVARHLRSCAVGRRRPCGRPVIDLARNAGER